MKNILRLAVLLFGLSVPAFAQHSATLSCTASTSVVSGYNVYRSTNGGMNYTKLNTALVPACSYTDLTIKGGTIYNYVMTAVDSSGVESAFSNVVTAIIPEAPPTGVKVIAN
jgi:fibronectin type 3 domain-containing protein